MYLTKHENKTFESETVMLSGNAYIRCTFNSCTLLLMNLAAHMENCSFNNCHWHFNYLLVWGDEDSRLALRNLLDQIGGKGGAGAIRFSSN